MNGNAMRKKLGPVADNIAMFLSGVDGFLHDLRDFSTVGAGSRIGIAFVHEPECRLLHSFGKHINNMLRHNVLQHNSFVPGFRGFLVVQGMVQPLVETGSTGFHGSGQVPVLACGAGGGDILFILFRFFIFRVLNSPLLSAMRAWRIATEVIPVGASIARFDDIVVLVRTFGTWGCLVGSVVIIPIATGAGFLFDGISLMLAVVAGPLQQFFFPLPPRRFIWGIILIAVAGDAGFLFDRYPLMFTCQTGRTSHLGFPPCILACRGFRGFRGFKVAKVHVTGCTGFRGFGEVAVCAGPTIWFVGHFLLMYSLMVSITHRVNRASAHRAIAPHARMSVISTNIVVVMVNVFAGI
jgi:hypothetical protein